MSRLLALTRERDAICHIEEVTATDGNVVLHADCSNRQLVSVPLDLPASVSVLHLDYNNITELNDSLARYHALKILSISCNPLKRLTRVNFQNLSLLQELDVSLNTFLTYIEREVFMDLPRLKVLNMACNRGLGFLPVIRSLSAAEFILDTLVLDGVTKSGHPIVLTKDVFNASSFSELRRLSLRGNHIYHIDLELLLTLLTVEDLNIGYNSPIGSVKPEDVPYLLDIIMRINVISLDVSHLFNGHARHEYCSGCPRRDYFQVPKYKDRLATTTYVNNTDDQIIDKTIPLSEANFLPPSVQFIYSSGLFGRGRVYPGANFGHNNIIYLNFSGSRSSGIGDLVYGLDNLQVLDASRCGMSVMPDRFLLPFPNLKVLLLAGNDIPNIIDVVRTATRNTCWKYFNDFTHLEILDLRGNYLKHVDLVLSCLVSLSHLDLSSNALQKVDSAFISEVNGLSNRNSSTFQVILNDNPFVCGCQSIESVGFLQGSTAISSNGNNTESANAVMGCLYLNETSFDVRDVSISRLKQDCAGKTKLERNRLLTILTPVLSTAVMFALFGILCYYLRSQIRLEWEIFIKKSPKTYTDSFAQYASVLCEDSEASRELVRRLERDDGTPAGIFPSSLYICPNRPELDQCAELMHSTQNNLFFVDDKLIANLPQWEFLIPDILQTRHLDNIALLLDSCISDRDLSACYPLWRLSKTRRCFGKYQGDGTKPAVWRKILKFVNPPQGSNIELELNHNVSRDDVELNHNESRDDVPLLIDIT